MSPIIVFTLGLLSFALVLAVWRGGLLEKRVALLLVCACIISSLLPFDRVTPPWGVIAIDTLVFAVLLFSCISHARLWIIFAAAFQFLIVLTHYIFVRNHELMQWAYVSAYYIWNIGLIVSLCCGAVFKKKHDSRSRVERREHL